MNIEHLAYSIDGVVNGKCYAGLGGSILLGGDGFLNAHGGVTYCSARQTSLYVLETTAPKLNPYDSELARVIMELLQTLKAKEVNGALDCFMIFMK